jgi:hypothetical protein
MRRWTPGEPAVYRHVERGRAIGAFPVNVVADTDELVALYMPGGLVVKWPHVDGRHIRELPLARRFTSEWHAGDHEWRGHGVLFLSRPGDAHGTWLLWDGEEQGERTFSCWYVNLEDPLRRTPIGFDSRDHTLDVVVAPDRSWSWKDEDELEAAVEHGWHSADEAAAIRAEGLRVVERIERWEPPFSDGWERWRPDPDWPVPSLPAGWDGVK